MEARVGSLAVGTRFDTLLTGRRGVVRVQSVPSDEGACSFVEFGNGTGKALHPDVRVRVVEIAPLNLPPGGAIEVEVVQ